MIRIALLNDDLYLVHGAKNVSEMFRISSLSVNMAYAIALKHCFGMSQKAVNTYINDNSGSQHKPTLGSNVRTQGRVSYQTHESLLKGLLGSGLAPTTDRFEREWTESLSSSNIGCEWQYLPDLLEFFENYLGSAVLKAFLGQELLSRNPSFVHELWTYDKVVMSLAKRLPRFCMPEAYALRDRLLLSIKRWHQFARASSPESNQAPDEDSDQYWVAA